MQTVAPGNHHEAASPASATFGFQGAPVAKPNAQRIRSDWDVGSGRGPRAQIISGSKVAAPPSFPLQYSTQISCAARTVLPARERSAMRTVERDALEYRCATRG